VLEGADVVGVVVHGLFVTSRLPLDLVTETRRLIVGIVELAEGVAELATLHEELEAVDERRIGILLPSER
jgi:hypothetical protein